MDVFHVRDRLIEDYREFTGSFVDIHDNRANNADFLILHHQVAVLCWPDCCPAVTCAGGS